MKKDISLTGYAVRGGVIVLISAVATGADAIQNYEFGLESGQLAAVMCVVFAFGIPVMAAVCATRGYTLGNVLAFGTFFGLTLFAAVNYHANLEGRRLAHGKNGAEAYNEARETLERAKQRLDNVRSAAARNAQAHENLANAARADAAKITETASVSTLNDLIGTLEGNRNKAEQTAADLKKAPNQIPAWRSAQSAIEAATTRRDAAKSKQDFLDEAMRQDGLKAAVEAQARQDEAALVAREDAARELVKTRPETPSGLAVLISGSSIGRWFGVTEHGAAETIAVMSLIGRILGTLIAQSIFHMGFADLADALAAYKAKRRPAPAPKKEGPVGGKKTNKRRKLPEGVADLTKVLAKAGKNATKMHVAQVLAARKPGQSLRSLTPEGMSWSTFHGLTKDAEVLALVEDQLSATAERA